MSSIFTFPARAMPLLTALCLCILLTAIQVHAFRSPLQSVTIRNSLSTENKTTHSFLGTGVRLKLSKSDSISYRTGPLRRSKIIRRARPVMLSKSSTDSTFSAPSTTSPTTSTNKYPLKIIIAGAPAAGKGTQCEIIKERYGVVHLSTGDILRAAVQQGTALGLQAKAFMDAGKLVPDELIIDVICDRLRQTDCQECGWLLDGFPRTKAQAEALQAAGMIPDAFVLLEVPEEVLVERVTGRRTDPITGRIYHLTFSPPESEEVAARLVQRSDDTAEKIKVRFADFTSHINAVKNSYGEKLMAINGVQKSSEVSGDVCRILDTVVVQRQVKQGLRGSGIGGGGAGRVHAKRPVLIIDSKL